MANFYYNPDSGVLPGVSFETQTEAEFNNVRTGITSVTNNVTKLTQRINKIVSDGDVIYLTQEFIDQIIEQLTEGGGVVNPADLIQTGGGACCRR
jgi:hypothetical protein